MRQYVTGKGGCGGKRVMHLSREACAKVRVQGPGGHVLLGVARAWATAGGRSQTFLPGTPASRKGGSGGVLGVGSVQLCFSGTTRVVAWWTRDSTGGHTQAATIRQLVDPAPRPEREREREMRFCCAAQGRGSAWRRAVFLSLTALSTHGPARCLQAQGEDVGGEAAPAVHSGGSIRIPTLKLPLALNPPARPRPRPLSLPSLSSAPEESRLARSSRSTCHTPSALAVFCWGSAGFLSSFFKGRRSRNNRKPRSHSKPTEVWPGEGG